MVRWGSSSLECAPLVPEILARAKLKLDRESFLLRRHEVLEDARRKWPGPAVALGVKEKAQWWAIAIVA